MKVIKIAPPSLEQSTAAAVLDIVKDNKNVAAFLPLSSKLSLFAINRRMATDRRFYKATEIQGFAHFRNRLRLMTEWLIKPEVLHDHFQQLIPLLESTVFKHDTNRIFALGCLVLIYQHLLATPAKLARSGFSIENLTIRLHNALGMLKAFSGNKKYQAAVIAVYMCVLSHANQDELAVKARDHLLTFISIHRSLEDLNRIQQCLCRIASTLNDDVLVCGRQAVQLKDLKPCISLRFSNKKSAEINLDLIEQLIVKAYNRELSMSHVWQYRVIILTQLGNREVMTELYRLYQKSSMVRNAFGSVCRLYTFLTLQTKTPALHRQEFLDVLANNEADHATIARSRSIFGELTEIFNKIFLQDRIPLPVIMEEPIHAITDRYVESYSPPAGYAHVRYRPSIAMRHMPRLSYAQMSLILLTELTARYGPGALDLDIYTDHTKNEHSLHKLFLRTIEYSSHAHKLYFLFSRCCFFNESFEDALKVFSQLNDGHTNTDWCSPAVYSLYEHTRLNESIQCLMMKIELSLALNRINQLLDFLGKQELKKIVHGYKLYYLILDHFNLRNNASDDFKIEHEKKLNTIFHALAAIWGILMCSDNYQAIKNILDRLKIAIEQSNFKASTLSFEIQVMHNLLRIARIANPYFSEDLSSSQEVLEDKLFAFLANYIRKLSQDNQYPFLSNYFYVNLLASFDVERDGDRVCFRGLEMRPNAESLTISNFIDASTLALVNNDRAVANERTLKI